MQTTFKEFCAENEGFIDGYIQEAYWYESFNPDNLLENLVIMAKEDKIDLVDINDFDCISFLETWYDCTEKGLS